jgi:hypothetical protein
VINGSLVYQIKFCDKSFNLRVVAKLYRQFLKKKAKTDRKEKLQRKILIVLNIIKFTVKSGVQNPL